MIRSALWVLAGLMLGVIIHIGVILVLPAYASNDIWSRVSTLNAVDQAVVLPAVRAGEPNPMGLDPELAYAVCQIDLELGPGVVSGVLPQGFWSVAVFDRAGTIIYSTTNRDGLGQALDMGIFNPSQTRLLAQQQLDIAEGLLIVEAPEDDVFAVVRVAPPYPAVRARYEAALSELVCGNIGT
jgi:uncharacterized membrane protein